VRIAVAGGALLPRLPRVLGIRASSFGLINRSTKRHFSNEHWSTAIRSPPTRDAQLYAGRKSRSSGAGILRRAIDVQSASRKPDLRKDAQE